MKLQAPVSLTSTAPTCNRLFLVNLNTLFTGLGFLQKEALTCTYIFTVNSSTALLQCFAEEQEGERKTIKQNSLIALVQVGPP